MSETFNEKKNQASIKKFPLALLAGVILCLGLSYMLCFYAPLDLYLTNISSFWFGIGSLTGRLVLIFLFVSLIGFLFTWLIYRFFPKVYSYYLAFLLGLYASFYIHGNILAGSLPPLGNSNVDWAADPQRWVSWGVISVCILAALLLCRFLKKDFFYKISSYTVGFISILLSVSLVTLFLQADLSSNNLNVFTEQDMLAMNREKNVVVLLLDMTDGTVWQETIESDPELKETFKDFTAYTDAMSNYPATLLSLPTIFSGELYTNEQPLKDWNDYAWHNSPFLNYAFDNDYSVGVYENGDIFINYDNYAQQFVNSSPGVTYASQWGAIKNIVKMAMVKYAPWDLKQYAYHLIDDININTVTPDGYAPVFTWEDSKFYNQINQEGAFTDSADPTFKYIHLEGSHMPFHLNKNMEDSAQTGESYRYADAVEASATVAADYIKKLQENGAYENTAIIIMSDHGYPVPFEDDYQEGLSEYRVHPFLYVKGFGEEHEELQYNEAQVSYENIAEAIIRLMEGAQAQEIFDVKEGETVERTFYHYFYGKSDKLEEVHVNGKVTEPEEFDYTGNIYYRESKE